MHKISFVIKNDAKVLFGTNAEQENKLWWVRTCNAKGSEKWMRLYK